VLGLQQGRFIGLGWGELWPVTRHRLAVDRWLWSRGLPSDTGVDGGSDALDELAQLVSRLHHAQVFGVLVQKHLEHDGGEL